MRFSVTLTLLPLWYKKDTVDQYDSTHEMVCDFLNHFSQQYTLVAEITKSSNIHYHASVVLKYPMSQDRLRFRMNNHKRRHRYIGFIKVDQITDEPQWQAYIAKDISTNKELLSRPPIVRDDLNYFPLLSQFFKVPSAA